MKKLITIIVVPLLMVCAGCNEAGKEFKKRLLPSFNVNIPDINLRVPPITFVAGKEVPVGALRTHINLDSSIKAHTAGAFGAVAITSVKVKKVVIQLLNADKTNNLSNFETARIRIYSNTDTTSSEIANLKFPATYSDSLAFTPAVDTEISNYLKGSLLGYNLFWNNRRTTSKSLKLVIRITLSVQ